MTGYLYTLDLERLGVTKEKEPLELVEECPTVVERKCVCCGKQQERMFQCSACHAGVYCSRTCQKKQWHSHKKLCTVITQLDAHLLETARLVESEVIIQCTQQNLALLVRKKISW